MLYEYHENLVNGCWSAHNTTRQSIVLVEAYDTEYADQIAEKYSVVEFNDTNQWERQYKYGEFYRMEDLGFLLAEAGDAIVELILPSRMGRVYTRTYIDCRENVVEIRG